MGQRETSRNENSPAGAPDSSPAPRSSGGGPARSTTVLRGINSTVVLRAIRLHKPLSRAGIARRTGLSRPTVNEVIEQLLDAGFVHEVDDTEPRRPGRRGKLLAFRADTAHVVGLDIGEKTVRALLCDLEGKVLASDWGLPSTGDAKQILSAVRGAISSVLTQTGLPRSAVRAIGAATPGVIDPVSGAVTLAPQLAGWEGTHLHDELQRTFDCPVVVEGVVRAALVGESARGLAAGCRNVAFIYLGTGVASAFMVDGHVYRGTNGAAGEIGFLPVSPTVPPEERHGFGSFEYAVGETAFARLGNARAREPDGEGLRRAAGPSGYVDARAVFAAAEEHDPAACQIVEQISDEIAKGIASVALVLDPELIVLGGELSLAGPLLRDPIVRTIGRLIPNPPRIEVSALGPEGVALGAMRLGLELAEEELFNFELRPLGKRSSTGEEAALW